MKVVMITPGSGGTFYCENCLRDVALIRALRARGHDVVVAPLYLPLFTDDPGVAAGAPVFFGGISTWLREKAPFLGRAPAGLFKLFDAPPLLRWAARRSGTTRPRGLGRMTLSMLETGSGPQAGELERLIEWLESSERPDVIQLSTSLLAGFARPLRERLGAPVVCMLQDEEAWLDGLDAPYDRLCWEAVRRATRDCAARVAVSHYYAGYCARKLGVPVGEIKVVWPGIEVEASTPRKRPGAPPVIGYLSKMTADMGLGTAVEAFMLLKRRPGLEDLRFRAMGGCDAAFVRTLRRRLLSRGLGGSADFLKEVDGESRRRFLESLTLMTVPVPGGVAFGTFLLEAMAARVPVVQPDEGAFRELIETTRGGVLYGENTAEALADTLELLLRSPERCRDLGARGRTAVSELFTVERMAGEMARIHESVTGLPARGLG
jgi:glycosyltransferase involved in cell wall biosynthesis